MFTKVSQSLEDLLGTGYINAVSNFTQEFLELTSSEVTEIAKEPVEFLPDMFAKKSEEYLLKTGMQVVPPFTSKNAGAPTDAFRKATNLNAAPIGGFSYFRVGEDGRLYFTGKSEHYHTPLGHSFPGYRLIDKARALGIPNATHNNTRGFITRLLEKQLIADIYRVDVSGNALNGILSSKAAKVLNRVINLETGSLAVEAGIKMMLARFYRLDKTYNNPKYYGKTPVFFVMADNDGGCEGNYHGTTVLAQTMRGMWPDFYKKIEESGIYKIISVKINDISDFEKKIEMYNRGNYKTAGFLHEIVLMNYGGIRLTKEYLQSAYTLCRKYDTPTLVDEIQSCMWYGGMFLFKQYDLEPDLVIIGKGFSGGEYPASKIITTFEMDSLNQFGALVTNGQEELASLSYLITMKFVRENSNEITRIGNLFDNNLAGFKDKYNKLISKIEGQGHLAAIHFTTIDQAVVFAKKLNAMCIDLSVQTYKANCPPAVLLKPPVIISEKTIHFLCEKIDIALSEMEGDSK